MQAKEKHDELLAEVPAAQQIIAPESWPAETLSCIQQRAYELWQARGGGSGSALDDWLQAEAEFKQAETSSVEPPGYSQRVSAG